MPSRKNSSDTPDNKTKKRRKSKSSSASSSFQDDSFTGHSPLGDQLLFHHNSLGSSALTPNFDQMGLADAEAFHFRHRSDGTTVDADDVAALTSLCTPGMFSPGAKFFDSASPRPLGGGGSLGLNTFGKLMGTPNGQRGKQHCFPAMSTLIIACEQITISPLA